VDALFANKKTRLKVAKHSHIRTAIQPGDFPDLLRLTET
jgi:hypothetical protein